MKSLRNWLAAVVFILTAAAFGQTPPEPEKPMTEPTLNDLYDRIEPLTDTITLAQLPNGLIVLVEENHVAPVATVRAFVPNTGGAFEGRWLGMGLSHLVEHLVSGGSTTHRTEEEIEQIIDTFGGMKNASTSNDLTTYYIDCPADKVATCIELTADSMQNVVFADEEFQREFRVVQQELADGEVSRQRVAWKLLCEAMFPGHPAKTPTIGYLDVLKTATRQDCVDFYHSRYVPNNQVFVVVGDVDTDTVLRQVAEQFAEARRGREIYLPMTPPLPQVGPKRMVREMEGATVDFTLAWPTVELSNDDLYALDVASYILGNGDSSRMVRGLKFERQLVLAIHTGSWTPHYVRGGFLVLGVATPDRWEEAIAASKEEVYRLCNDLVSEEELTKAKKQKAAELVFEKQTVQDEAESLANAYLSTGDPLFNSRYVENIQKVTAEQIRDAARRYFRPDRLNEVIIAPPGTVQQQQGKTAEEKQHDVQLVRLDNGLRVLVKRHTNLPLVDIRAFVLGATLVETPETAGRSALVAAMLDKGTPSYTAQELADYFDSIGGKFGAGSGRNTIYVNAQVLKADWPEALQRLAECTLRPTFPESEFATVKQLALGAIAQRANNPQQEAFELFYDNLPVDSPYHIQQGGTLKTVGPVTAADLKAYHDKYFVPENMIVTVFGDVDPDQAIGLVREKFGALQKPAQPVVISFDRSNAIAEDVVVHKTIGKPTGMVLLGYPGPSIFDQKDYAAMTVLDAITSGYSYPGGWLHSELRGEGLVYYVHAFQMSGPVPGYFAVMAQTRPDAVDEVVGRIQKNLARAKAGDISPEEFDTAIQMILSLHAQENTTIGEQAMLSALNELYGLGYDYDKKFDEQIKAVTLQDVVAAANKYLTHYVQATTSPAPQAEASATPPAE